MNTINNFIFESEKNEKNKAFTGVLIYLLSIVNEYMQTHEDSSEIESFLKDYNSKEEEIFIIGGASIYKQFIDMAEKLYLTEVQAQCIDADVYFPTFDKTNYDKEIIGTNNDNGISYKHVLYKRR